MFGVVLRSILTQPATIVRELRQTVTKLVLPESTLARLLTRSRHASVAVVTDWEGLRRAATEVAERAYAPYSGYRVGAAARTEDGRVLVGCNVENAGYGVTLCAECGVVSQLHATGGGRLREVLCVNGEGTLIMPCGRCRQLLYEAGGPELAILTPEGALTMADVLPQAFGPADLTRGSDTDG